MTASPSNEYKDLFAAIPNSLGSFGYLLRLRMRVMPVKALVKITKTWIDGPDAFVEGLRRASGKDEVSGSFLFVR